MLHDEHDMMDELARRPRRTIAFVKNGQLVERVQLTAGSVPRIPRPEQEVRDVFYRDTPEYLRAQEQRLTPLRREVIWPPRPSAPAPWRRVSLLGAIIVQGAMWTAGGYVMIHGVAYIADHVVKWLT